MIQRVQIFTVDPSTRGIEFILKDGTMVQSQVWEVPSFFRWPRQGEFWTVERTGNYWKLGNRMEDVNTEFPVESLAEGEAKVNADTVYTEAGARLAVVADTVAALPTTDLYDGRPIFVQTPAMAADGVRWHLVYAQGSASARKWEFVGGSDLLSTVGVATTASSTPVLSGGPSLIVPFSGDYDIWMNARAYNVNAAGASSQIILCINGTPSLTMDAFQGTAGGTTTLWAGDTGRSTRTALIAGATVDLRMAANGGGTMTADYRTLRVRPVRVG